MRGVPFDNEEELRRRTAQGGRIPLGKDHPQVQRALSVARLSSYCQALRPFGTRVVNSLKHGGRAGAIPAPPTLPLDLAPLPPIGPLAALAALGGWQALDVGAKGTFVAANDHGVRSPRFVAAAGTFLPLWNVLLRSRLISHDPRKREPDPLRRAFVISLVQWLPGYRLGPAQLALLAAVVGIDTRIERETEDDTIVDAIARRALRYGRLWKLAKKAGPMLRRSALRLSRGAPLRN